ncbi:GTP-binding protein [Halovenus salina]|uniref:GTP-binding protein n=1 Tax=Halovenus salina TaxID=1510225 RepID=A0ABD5W1U1_9EURY
MVCPADFPLGAQARVLVVSTTEGDDVVRKHPLLFQACDVAVVNKADIADAVGADIDQMRDDVAEIAPEMPVFETNARDGGESTRSQRTSPRDSTLILTDHGRARPCLGARRGGRPGCRIPPVRL